MLALIKMAEVEAVIVCVVFFLKAPTIDTFKESVQKYYMMPGTKKRFPIERCHFTLFSRFFLNVFS